MKGKYKTLVSDTLLFAITNFASKVISFLLIPLYTNVLTTSDYGIADLIQTTVNFLYPILTLSISEATIRFAIERDKNKDKVLTTSLFFIFAGTTLLALFTPFAGNVNADLKEYWIYFLIYYLLHNIHYCISQYTRGCNKLKLFAMQGLIHTVVVIVSNIILLVIFHSSVYGYLCSFYIGYIVAIFIMIIGGKYGRELFQFEFDKQLIVEMLKYSIPMIPTQVFWWLNNAADKWVITYFFGVSENGIYSVAHKIPTILTTVIAIFNQAWQVSAFKNFGKEDTSSFFSNVYAVFAFINFTFSSAIITFSQVIGKIMFSSGFYIGWVYVPILVVAAVFNGLSGMLASVFTSSKKTSSLFISTGIGAIVNLIFNIIFVPILGSMGAAYTTAFSCIVVWVVRIIQTNKYIKIDISYISQIVSLVVVVVQSYLVSNQIGNVWIIGACAFTVILLMNIEQLRKVINVLFADVKSIMERKKAR